MKYSKEENYLYQDRKIVPVICTPRSGPTDITFKYLDMRKFFEFKKTANSFYLRKDWARNCIDKGELHKKILEQFCKENIVVSNAKRIEADLVQFEVKAPQLHHYIGNLLLSKCSPSHQAVEL